MTRQDRWPLEIARARNEAWASRKILRVIRANCLECMGGSAYEIAKCTSRHCPLFPFRGAESVRQGFDNAADHLDREGLSELAAKSRELRAANMLAWTERRTAVLGPESRDSCAVEADEPDEGDRNDSPDDDGQ